MTVEQIIGWVSLAVTVFFLAKGGFDKLRGSSEAVSNFNYMKLSKYRMAVGFAEIIAALLLVTPGLSLYGLFVVVSLMSGAAALHLSLMNGQKTWLPVLVGVLAAISYVLR